MSINLTPHDILNIKVKLWSDNRFDVFLPKDENGDTIPFPKQEEAWNIIKGGKIKDFAYGGASGGAKTHTMTTAMLFQHLAIPGLHSAVCRKELKDLTRTTLVSFIDAIKMYQIPFASDHKKRGKDDLLWYNKQDSCWYFKNGSVIYFVAVARQPTDPTYEQFGSYMLSYVWFEEAQQIDFQAYVKMGQRVGRQVELYRKTGYVIDQILITMNPSKNWVYNLFYLPQKDGTIERHKLFMGALAKDNPTLPPEYLKRLDNIPDPIERAKQRDGEWEYDDNKKALFAHNTITNMFTYTNINSGGVKYITFDLARQGSDNAIGWLFEGHCVIGLAIAKKCRRQDIETVIDYWKNTHTIPNDNISLDANGMGEFFGDGYIGCFEFKSHTKPIVDFAGNIRASAEIPSDYRTLRDQVFFVASDLAIKGIPQFSQNIEIIKFGENTETFSMDRNILQAEFRKELEQVLEISKIDDPKKKINKKEDIALIINRSPDYIDSWSQRFVWDSDMYQQNDTPHTVTIIPSQYDSDYVALQRI